MTKRYTVADFANAKFAEHEDGRTAMKPSGHTRWDVKSLDGRRSVRGNYHMASSGWVPVPTKPQMTESEYERVLAGVNEDYATGYIDAVNTFGIEVIPDPEPTNTDRLEKLIISAPGNFEGVEAILKRPANVRAWAEYLNDHGVTAPKENN